MSCNLFYFCFKANHVRYSTYICLAKLLLFCPPALIKVVKSVEARVGGQGVDEAESSDGGGGDSDALVLHHGYTGTGHPTNSWLK